MYERFGESKQKLLRSYASTSASQNTEETDAMYNALPAFEVLE